MTIDLSGTWSCRLDPEDVGLTQAWHENDFEQAIQLPGSLQVRGFGSPPTLDTTWTGTIRPEVIELPRYAPYRTAENFRMPFWLQPKHTYVGPAWYQRSVVIPADWHDRRIALTLERCHWFTTVWVDGQEVGQGESLSVPHQYDLTERLAPGEHRITVRVDNRVLINVGHDSHSVTDHTQTNWNGIIGRMELAAQPRVWIDDVQVFPKPTERQARVHIEVRGRTPHGMRGSITVQVSGPGDAPPPVTADFALDGDRAAADVTLTWPGDVKLWNEHHPHLYTLEVRLTGDVEDCRRTTFGMREVSTQGTQFALNGEPIQLRGTLECCIFPLTGYPAMDVAAWRRIIQRCKEFGLNHIRFHSWCPPEAAFVAADELGFYFQVECASWANGGASVGDGTALDEWLYREADRILRAYGNHPSFLLLAYGNEPAGPGPQRMGEDYLAKWVTHYKEQAPRQLVTCASGWPYLAESDFHVMHAPLRQHRLFDQQAPDTTRDYGQHVAKFTVPLISHETGQWCVFPNLDEMGQYTGVLEPKNFEIVRDFLAEHGLLPQAHDFLLASGRLQTLLYKEEVEIMLRSAGLGGFQLLDLHDFPGQGTALIGVLDPFWNPKPYVTAAEFRGFCGPVVPLARFARRVWTNDQKFKAAVDVSQFGPQDLDKATVDWTLRNDAGQSVGEGRWIDVVLPRGRLSRVGSLQCSLAAVHAASRLTLTVSIAGSSYSNYWHIWVYPAQLPEASSADVLVTRSLDESAMADLAAGKKVLLLPRLSTIAGDTYGSFEAVFWNRLWFPTQQVHTLGVLCDPGHPALTQFPTDTHTNWQWWELCTRSKPVVLDQLPRELKPVVQVIDDWNTCRKLALVFEAQVGPGKLVVCAIDLTDDLAARPAARQLRHSLLTYMASGQFHPSTQIDASALRELFRAPTKLEEIEATVTANSQQPGYEAQRAIDGNPQTIWHTAWGPGSPAHPHELILDLRTPCELRGITCLPRQDMRNGRISRYEIYASNAVDSWGPPVVTGTWPDGVEQQTVTFPTPVVARYVRLVALSEVGGQPFASVAELDVLQ